MNSHVAPELSVVLPCFEEAANLNWLLPLLKPELSALHITFETLVVDAEMPRDETPEICRKNSVRYVPRLGGASFQWGDTPRTLSLECSNLDIIEKTLLKLSLRDFYFSILELPFTFQARKAGRTKRDLIAFMFSYLGTLNRLRRIRKSAIGKHP